MIKLFICYLSHQLIYFQENITFFCSKCIKVEQMLFMPESLFFHKLKHPGIVEFRGVNF